jgi:hypothetical protein
MDFLDRFIKPNRKKRDGWRYMDNPPLWAVRKLGKSMKRVTCVKGKHFEYKRVLIPAENHYSTNYYKRKLKK